MIFIENRNSHDPAINLALEEYLSKQLDNTQSYLLLYQNRPSVILGRNQNLYEEIDFWYAHQREIGIYRRVSGGGAVFHDLGNLNYSFLQPFDTQLIGNWAAIAAPVLKALNQKNVPAALNYRNDILVDGKKVSGTAQRAGKHLMVSHGTLLFDSDLEALFRSLNPDRGTITSQSLKSFRSKVTNLRGWLPRNWTVSHLRDYLRETISTDTYALSEAEWRAVEELAEEKYRSWDWVFGRSPAFTLERQMRWENTQVTMRLEVQRGGRIQSLKFSEAGSLWATLARELPGTSYRLSDLRKTLRKHFLLPPQREQKLIEFLYG